MLPKLTFSMFTFESRSYWSPIKSATTRSSYMHNTKKLALENFVLSFIDVESNDSCIKQVRKTIPL